MVVSDDIELLGIQGEVALDASGRVAGLYGIAIASTGEQGIAWIGADIPDDLAAELKAVVDRVGRSSCEAIPSVLEDGRRILEVGGRTVRGTAGHVFVIHEDVCFPTAAHIERSDTGASEVLRRGNPGNWHPVEWDELLDGRLGPWTIALDGDLVVSICHTARPLTPRAAECGVWTRGGYRGRGYAAAVTSAWAELLRPSGCHLFYSCDEDNRSSHRVARRLNLRRVGWTWTLALVRQADADENVHRLSSLRRNRIMSSRGA